MTKVAILQANLGNFDECIDPIKQEFDVEVIFHRYTDKNFSPITGLTPRLQYRIPKTHGWEMFPGYDIYIWIDGGISFERSDCVKWFIEQLGDKDAFFFRHPFGRRKIRHEVEHIDEKLKANHPYMIPRYGNGLHKEMYNEILKDKDYKDNRLYASTVFAYRNIPKVQQMLKDWWYYQSRYYTCDQIHLPYVIWKNKLDINVFNENLFKIGYVSLVSHHKEFK